MSTVRPLIFTAEAAHGPCVQCTEGAGDFFPAVDYCFDAMLRYSVLLMRFKVLMAGQENWLHENLEIVYYCCRKDYASIRLTDEHYATSGRVAGTRPDEVNEFFQFI
jgi:hypothetical protein